MFCLFRNSQIIPSFNRHVVLLSSAGTLWWLYFSFIEKSFFGKIFEGQALLVDLVFGLPLVLMLAVVVYATIYWACKLLLMFLLPQAIIMKSAETQQLEDELEEQEIQSLEEDLGESYWQDREKSVTETKQNKSEQTQSEKTDLEAENRDKKSHEDK